MLLPLLYAAIAFGANLNTDPLPPKVLYHMGQKTHLLEDAKAGTIPEDVWRENIMGRGNRFGLVPYRRGFYGGKNLDTLELYGNTYLGSPGGKAKEPWALKITLKDECLKPAAVSDLATDEKYLGWLLANVNFLTHDVDFCLNPTTSTCDNLIIGTQPVAGGREENVCDDVMQKFMTEVNPRVVRDTEWDSSWYLRDRSCIESLEASPLTILTALAEAKWDWESRRSSYRDSPVEKTNGYGMSFMAMLVGALKDSSEAPANLLAEIRKKTAASDIRLGAAPEGKLWVAATGTAVLDAFSRCAKQKKLDHFEKIAEKFAAELKKAAIGSWEEQERVTSSLASEAALACRGN